MIWLSSILLYLHVIGAIFWVGSSMMFQYIFVPALADMPYESQRPWLQALAARYGPVVGVVGALTLLFGVLLGISTGVLGAVRTAYGVTWLAAIVLAVPLIVLGGAFIGPTGNKMGAAASRDEVMTLAGRMKIYGRLESAAILVLVALMVAMHAGY